MSSIAQVNTFMKKQTKYNRYHRYDMNGKKYIKRYELGVEPVDVADEGYTCWTKGTGPHSEEAYKKVSDGIRKACKGVPKSDEQKQKMRDAKLGVPKTEEHKINMRKSFERKRLQNEKNSTGSTQTIQSV
jgi:hypothetical protein